MSKKESERASKKKQRGKPPPGGRGRPKAARVAKNNPECVRSDGHPYTRRQSYEIKRKAVQLFMEEGIPAHLVAKEIGIAKATVFAWAKQYREGGEEGLKPKTRACRTVNKLPDAVAEKITEIKRESPERGVKWISQVLRRFFFMKASPATVRRQLRKSGLVEPPKKARRKKVDAPPRRFEASTPNQMWQTDITYFQILGKMAYIIGFIDDNSRFITGIGMYRSHTSEHVIETYRLASGQFGVPKEMLTDNGRQYASWRGKTKFQKELAKDHVHHIRSRPEHPMTLGKIERFWKTLKEEFLRRARFETFEEARERLAYWVKYYNHKRPHQSLDGMTPADRFFSIQEEMRAAIERGVAANVEEMALRGKPEEPFYMVGRVGDKSVVIETDKKRVSVMVDGQELGEGKSITYERKERSHDETGTEGSNSNGNEEAEKQCSQCEGKGAGSAVTVERQEEHGVVDKDAGCTVGDGEQLGEAGSDGNADRAGSVMEEAGRGTVEPSSAAGETDWTDSGTGISGINSNKVERSEHHEDNGTGSVRSGGEVPGSTGSMDGAENSCGTVQGDGGQCVPVLPVAGSGTFWYVGSAGVTRDEGWIRRSGASGADQALAGSQEQSARAAHAGKLCQLAGQACEAESKAGSRLDPRELLNKEVNDVDGRRSESAEAHAGDPGSPGRSTECNRGISGARGEQEDLLRVVGSGPDGDVPGAQGQAHRPSAGSGGPGEGSAAGVAGDCGKGADHSGIQASRSGSHAADYERNRGFGA